MAKIASTSTEFLIVKGLRPFDPDAPDALVDITTLPVYMAIIVHQDPMVEPASGDWVAAHWVNSRKLWIKFGPDGGAISKPVGKYDVWVWVQGTAESPKRKVGMLQVNPAVL